MNIFCGTLLGAGLGLGVMMAPASAQTDGSVNLDLKLSNYTGESGSTKHWTVVWVTTSSGTFIKTLRRQGPSVTSSKWNSHCRVWWTAKQDTANGGNNSVDGYTSATTSSYSSLVVPWDCRDKDDNLVADGDYKFLIQYAEDDGQGPTAGTTTSTVLQWTKGPSAFSTSYPDQGSSGSPSDGNNFTGLAVAWTPVTSPPAITSAAPPAGGTVGVSYTHTCTATGTAPMTFSASGLPTGLGISSAGVISGTPEVGGPFSGTITASNGTAPNATQAFSIDIVEVPVRFAIARILGENFLMSGTGPANGHFTVLSAPDPALPLGSWTEVTTGGFNGSGFFIVSLPRPSGVREQFYRLQVP